jgi:glycosyltransferase involved in cell wall biosynthesis
MRIIQIIQRPQARGAEIFASQLSTVLENLGHQVLMISLFEGDYELPFEGKQIHLQLSLGSRLWNVASWIKLGKIIQDFKPEIVQANGADTLKFSVFAKRFHQVQYQLIFNNGGVVSYYLNSTLKKIFNQFLFNQVDALISVSNYSKEDLDNFISNPKPHQVIPIGIEYRTRPKVRETTSFQILVHLAGFTPEKNHETVLRIFEGFLLKHPKSQLWLMGDGPQRRKIEDLVSESSFSEKVRFFGAISNPFSMIPSNSIVILPSKIEGLPAVILEAFHSRIAVIAFQVGGIPDVVIPDQTGVLVAGADESGFVEALDRYMKLSSDEKQSLKDNAFQLVKEQYSIANAAKKFEGFYLSLCE